MTMKSFVLIVAATLAVAARGANAACADATDCATCVVMPDCYYYDGKCSDMGATNSCEASRMPNQWRFGSPAMPAEDACAVVKARELAAKGLSDAQMQCKSRTGGCKSCVPAAVDVGSDVCQYYQYTAERDFDSFCALDQLAYRNKLKAAGNAPRDAICTATSECADDLECKQPPMPKCPEGMACPTVMPPMTCMDKLDIFKLENPDSFTGPSKNVTSTTMPDPMPAGRRLLCSALPGPNVMVKTMEECGPEDPKDSGGDDVCDNLSCDKCLQQESCYLQMSDGTCQREVVSDTCYGPPQALNKDRFPEGFASDAEAAPACAAITAKREWTAKQAAMQKECQRLKFCDSCQAAAYCTFQVFGTRASCALDTAAFVAAMPMPTGDGVPPVAPGISCPDHAMPEMPTSEVKDGETCPSTGVGSEKDPTPYTDQTDKIDITVTIEHSAASALAPAIAAAAATALLLIL